MSGGCGCGGIARQLNQLSFALALVLVTQHLPGTGEAGLLCSAHAFVPTKQGREGRDLSSKCEKKSVGAA